MVSSDQFNIRWNNYTHELQNVFRKLLDGEQFVDVTLACEGRSIKCHRMILSACSTYFNRILSDNPSSNLVIYLTDMKFWELRALVTFMYNGEVSISEQKLPNLCKAAKALKVKGLADDTGLPDEDELDDNRVDGKESPLQQLLGTIHHGQQQPLFRQHNNLSAFAAAANRQAQQFKRKILLQPPTKLVKMRRVEQPNNGATGNGVGGNIKPQHIPISAVNKINVKKPETGTNRSVTSAKETAEDEEGGTVTVTYEVTADSSMTDEGDVLDHGEENEEVDAGDNDSIFSEEDDTHLGKVARPNKIAMKYGKEVRDSALFALQSGMTLRQCSEAHGIAKKMLSKWKSSEAKQDGKEGALSPNRAKDGTSVNSRQVARPPNTRMSVPVDYADRAERFIKATELAMSGVTVRQAAARFEIPRTTLCAYMKRRGLVAKRNSLPNNSGSANNLRRVQVKSDSSAAKTKGQGGGNSYH